MNNCEWFSLFSHAFTHNAWLMFLEFWLGEHMRVEAVKIPRSMVFSISHYCRIVSLNRFTHGKKWCHGPVYWFLNDIYARNMADMGGLHEKTGVWSTSIETLCIKVSKKRVPDQLAKNQQNKMMMFPSKDTETSNLGDGHLSLDHIWTKLKSWLTLDTVHHGWVGNMSGYGNRETNI